MSSRVQQGADHSDRAALVAQLAPTAPPCFGSRDQWLTFVAAAAVGQRIVPPGQRAGRHREPIPLVLIDGEPAFNRQFEFCEDCTHAYRLRMVRQGKCDPDALRSRADAEHARVMRLVDAELAGLELSQ